MKSNWKSLFTDFLSYINRNKFCFIFIFVMSLICFGSKLFTTMTGIDTEDIISEPQNLYTGWLATGRQGLVFLKWITGTSIYNPYFAGVLLLLFLNLACMVWTFLFTKLTGEISRRSIFAFSALILSHPIMTEQFYFMLQSAEISLAFVLLGISLLLAANFAENKFTVNYSNISMLVVGISLALLTFGEYQIMVALFIFGAVICFLLSYKKAIYSNDCVGSNLTCMKGRFTYIGKLILYFLIAFGLNMILTACFFSGSSYLANELAWSENGLAGGIYQILLHVAKASTGFASEGELPYYSITYGILELIFLLLVIVGAIRNKGKNGIAFYVVCNIFLLLSPFFITILCGGIPALRSQLVLVFLTGFIGYYVLLLMKEQKERVTAHAASLSYQAVYILLPIFLFITCFLQLKSSLQLQYTARVCYEEDVAFARELSEKIEPFEDGANGFPILFIGSHEAILNPSCITGEVSGHSIFAWDTEVEPRGFYSSRRIVNFMNTLGMNYWLPPESFMKDCQSIADTMPCYPMEGSILRADTGIIIIKLSNDEEITEN